MYSCIILIRTDECRTDILLVSTTLLGNTFLSIFLYVENQFSPFQKEGCGEAQRRRRKRNVGRMKNMIYFAVTPVTRMSQYQSSFSNRMYSPYALASPLRCLNITIIIASSIKQFDWLLLNFRTFRSS